MTFSLSCERRERGGGQRRRGGDIEATTRDAFSQMSVSRRADATRAGPSRAATHLEMPYHVCSSPSRWVSPRAMLVRASNRALSRVMPRAREPPKVVPPSPAPRRCGPSPNHSGKKIDVF
eukprot:31135-Pelagococcus_subviridis.AAC.2